MKVACPRCLYPLRSQVRGTRSARTLVHFDDNEQGASYGERTPRCPVCGLKLDRHPSEDGMVPRA